MEWWEEGEPAPLAKPATAALSREEVIRNVETELHAEATGVMRDTLRFADLSEEEIQASTPPAWMVAECQGDDRAAARRFRVAKYALSPSKEAPIGLKLSKDLMVGMAKVRAKENAPAKTINVMMVALSAPLPKFDSMEVEPSHD